MIKVYCQYSVSGFKIFNTLGFPHQRGNDLYVKMGEISQSLKQEEQNLLVTSKSRCGLPAFAINLFGSRDAQIVLVSERQQTTLFLSHAENQLAYVLVAESTEDALLLRTMACLWLQDRNSLLPKLQSLTEKVIEGEELVLMFHKGAWESLCQDMKNVDTNSIESRLRPVLSGKKNLIVNNVVGKGRILANLGINHPVSSFVSIPGNDIVANMEKRQRMIGYAIVGAAVGLCIIGGIALCCGTK